MSNDRPGAAPAPDSLWAHADFLRLWGAQTISVFGGQFTRLAVPIIAVLTIQASPAQMGVLSAAGTAPFLLFGLIAGAWVDRLPRRPVMIVADIGRAVVLGAIPLAAAAGVLGMPLFYLVAFVVGLLAVFFDVAYQAYLPALVPRERIVEGNSKLEASRSLAQLSGPSLAGVLIEAISGPVAIIVDAVSLLYSALLLGRIRTPEPRSQLPRSSFLAEVHEGMSVVLGNPLLRAIAGCTATWNFFGAIWTALYILFATRELGLTPATIGLIAGGGSAAGLLASLGAARVAHHVGVGRTIIGAAFAGGAAALPIVAATPATAVWLLAAASTLANLTGQVYNITQVSLRQAIVPDRLQGRMNATIRFLVWGTMPLGGLAGGALGERLGLRAAIGVGAVGSLLAFLWVVLSPLRGLERVPPPAE